MWRAVATWNARALAVARRYRVQRGACAWPTVCSYIQYTVYSTRVLSLFTVFDSESCHDNMKNTVPDIPYLIPDGSTVIL